MDNLVENNSVNDTISKIMEKQSAEEEERRSTRETNEADRRNIFKNITILMKKLQIL